MHHRFHYFPSESEPRVSLDFASKSICLSATLKLIPSHIRRGKNNSLYQTFLFGGGSFFLHFSQSRTLDCFAAPSHKNFFFQEFQVLRTFPPIFRSFLSQLDCGLNLEWENFPVMRSLSFATSLFFPAFRSFVMTNRLLLP